MNDWDYERTNNDWYLPRGYVAGTNTGDEGVPIASERVGDRIRKLVEIAGKTQDITSRLERMTDEAFERLSYTNPRITPAVREMVSRGRFLSVQDRELVDATIGSMYLLLKMAAEDWHLEREINLKGASIEEVLTSLDRYFHNLSPSVNDPLKVFQRIYEEVMVENGELKREMRRQLEGLKTERNPEKPKRNRKPREMSPISPVDTGAIEELVNLYLSPDPVRTPVSVGSYEKDYGPQILDDIG